MENSGREQRKYTGKEWGENRVEGVIIIGEDFDARTGKKGEGRRKKRIGSGKGGVERQSKDEKVNRGGRKLINLIEEMGRSIFNGCTKGDEKGEFTFTAGRGNTVIDYIIGEKRMWDRIERIKVGEKVDFDHQLVEVWIKAITKKRENKKEK